MKLIHKHIKQVIELPFEIGVTYVTKLSTGDLFTVDKIDMYKGNVIRLWGRYDKHPDLTNCPILPERLIPKTQETGNGRDACLCPHCKKEITE